MKTESRAERPEGENREAPAQQPAAGQSRGVGRTWVVVLLTLWTLGNAAGFAFFRGQGRVAVEVPNPEIGLGDFKFRADLAERGPVAAAQFSLHVAFAPQSEQAGRERLAVRKFRVQQDVEELLRRAHGADFDDPRLRELKRQIQEQINETLGTRAVADVIITDLVVEPSSERAAERAEPAAAAAAAPKKPRA